MDSLPLSIAVAAGLLGGFLLILGGHRLRRRLGLGEGRTISLDSVLLVSHRLGISGRADRLIRIGGTVIPEEWKSALRVQPWHKVQIGVYFLLIEDQLGVVPPHGYIVCGDGSRHEIANTPELRAEVLSIVDTIRAARATVIEPITVNPAPRQCRPCGQRANCKQAKT